MKDLSLEELKVKRITCLHRLEKADFNILRGSIIERYKRCGKSGCKCAKGRGHGPKYYLSVSFPGRRPEMIYIPLDVKKNVESCLGNFQILRQQLEEVTRLNLELLKRKEPFY
jgi:hypothetical protein